nr:uncharacterized protein LOC129382511 [Dermacentor andersoni]
MLSTITVYGVLLLPTILSTVTTADETQVPPNPELIDKLIGYSDFETYQDVNRCIPFNDRWFVMYRNKDQKDEVFDPTDDGKCAHMLTDMRFVDGKINVTIADTYGQKDYIFELQTYEGRSTATGFKVTTAADPYDEGKMIRVLYADCMHCIIFNLEYMDTYACNMLAPLEDARGSRIAGHCEYIYNMLCGTEKKWIYDCCDRENFMYQYL